MSIRAELPNASEAKPGLINISFDYPFQLRCPPLTYPIALESGETGFVKIEHKQGLVIYDKGRVTAESSEKMEVVRAKKSEAEIRLQTNDGSWVYVDADENGRVMYPKFFTKIEVIFPVNDLRASPAATQNRKYLSDLCDKFFQRFLFAYMYGVGDFVIEPAEKNSWPVQKRYKAYTYTEEDKVFLAREHGDQEFFKRFVKEGIAYSIYPGLEEMAGLMETDISLSDHSSVKKPNCTEDGFRRMFKGLEKPQAIEPHLVFIFSAIRRSHMDKENFFAIVDLVTSVEVAFSYYYNLYEFLFNSVDESAPHAKERIRDIESRIEKFDNKTQLQSKDPKQNTKVRMLDSFKSKFEQLFGNKHTEVSSSQEFQDWLEKVYKLRNKIVHTGDQLVTKERVSEALKLTQNIIRMVGFDQDRLHEAHNRVRAVK